MDSSGLLELVAPRRSFKLEVISMNQNRYILYARKSTDVEDKQVLSIEAQLAELRKFAKDNGYIVVDTIIEKKSAKTPGRPKFGDVLQRIQNGEADSILAWHPDRLARNSIDGGQIIYLLDQTTLNFLRFPMFQFDNTSQGKFMPFGLRTPVRVSLCSISLLVRANTM